MKILIVSGFLGAGKTTFIKHVVKTTGKEFAILENEYGDIGVDGDILSKETEAGKLNIWEVTEGCICCSMKGDFAASVLTIANSVDPEYLLIEPTGVGFLSKIIENLKQIEYERISILNPITIVDGLSFNRYIIEYPILYKDQLQSAGIVFVSNMENSSEAEKEWLLSKLKKLNPNGKVVIEHYTSMSVGEFSTMLNTGYDGRDYESLKEMDKMPENLSLEDVVINDLESLIILLENVIRGKYGNIIRAKGVIASGAHQYRFDVADGKYIISEELEDIKAKAVFIGDNIKRHKLRKRLF
ncbi:MAG: hypothetical protein GXZ11_05205 [Tissierellia bacterium]|nr:hypothetical protein [Tissierellia bacterium]